MFSQMRQAALERLAGRDPKDIAVHAGVDYNEETNTFHFQSLGLPVTVQYPDYDFCPRLPDWHALVILHYLDLADGTPVTDTQIPFGQMQSGMIRGGGIDRKCELAIQQLHGLTDDSLQKLCSKIGGEPISSNADMAFRMSFMPRFPVTLKIWLPDEEFPASGRLFVDAVADHYLTIEDAVTVAQIILEAITKATGVL